MANGAATKIMGGFRQLVSATELDTVGEALLPGEFVKPVGGE